MKFQKYAKRIFFFLTLVALTTPFWVSKELLFPFVTTKAFFLRIAVELALPFYIYLIVSRQSYRPSLKSPLNLAVLAFLLINFISAIFGLNVVKSLWGNFERMGGAYYMAHLVLLYFYVLLLAKINANWIKKLLDGAIIIAVLTVINGILTMWGVIHLVPDPSLPRVSSTFGNPIFFASFLVIPAFFSWFFALREESRLKKVWYITATTLQLIGIYLSGTRGAVVGLIIAGFLGSAVYLFQTPKKKVRAFGLAAAVIMLGLTIVLFTVKEKLPTGSMLQRVVKLNDSNSQARLIQWKVALRGFKDHPILGVGPEAYYVISNKYFNPEIYKYDPSWFDKPHNYLLEILVTDGSLGFLAYAAMLLFCVWALYKAYKRGIVTSAEFCVLLMSLIAYQIQNLFVFDTVSASMIFFVFLGFCGFLWDEARPRPARLQAAPSVYSQELFNFAVFMVSAVAAAYLIFSTNFLPALASRDVNYGYAYATVDPQLAQGYFVKALQSPFNFDLGESASKYQEFAATVMQQRASLKDPGLAENILNCAINTLEQTCRRENNNPIYWYKLANLYMAKSFYFKEPLNPRALEAINTAVSLAPQRIDPLAVLLQIEEVEGKFTEANQLAETIVKINPQDLSLQLQLAMVYRNSGKINEAVNILENLFRNNYPFSSLDQFSWLMAYYESQGQFGKALPWYELAVKISPNDINVFVALAKTYAEAGQKDKAINLAQAIEKFDATKSAEMDALIKSLK